MLKNVRHVNLGARQLTFTQRVHTQYNNDLLNLKYQSGSKSPSKFRVTQKISLSGKKIKSEAQSPQTNNTRTFRSSTYRKLQPNNRKKKEGRIIANINDFIEQKVTTQKDTSPKKILIKSNGLFDFQETAISQRKMSQKSAKKDQIKQQRGMPQIKSLEEQQMAKYPIYYRGKRTILSKKDFTDHEGNPKIQVGDAIAYRYQILSLIGQGAFGKVFKAIDHKKNDFIALKIIKSIPRLNQQSKVQVQILQKIHQKDPVGMHNIVRIKGSFTFRGHACIVYELLKMNLYQYLKFNDFIPVQEKIIVKFAIQILYSLFLLEKNDIVHCDVKPQNIMLKQQNKTGVKLIDFGSGCFTPKQIYTYIQSRYYRAPQIILGLKYTSAIDMWSFACVVAELWTGYPLFAGQNQQQQMLLFIQILGYPPKNILDQAPRRKKFFNDNYQCRILQSQQNFRLPKSKSLQKALHAKQNKNLIDFMKKCLQWDPSKRIKPKQALLHPWIIQNLPPSIQTRHIYQVNGEGS